MDQQKNETPINKGSNIKKQMILYLIFAVMMILLNYLIQKLNQLILVPLICLNFGEIDLIEILYCSTTPYDMPELVGSILAVGITYLTKYTLDKFVVFKRREIQLKETSIEFSKYFLLSILFTIENIGVQFLLTNFLGMPLEISMMIALLTGYTIRFFVDRKYVFKVD
ncbi:MAG: GtrA family protein [Promethearchaeota archaeon]|nr:MAG: GtrA family protein [Candidatus Lokiarchaeota archaeon]